MPGGSRRGPPGLVPGAGVGVNRGWLGLAGVGVGVGAGRRLTTPGQRRVVLALGNGSHIFALL